MCLLEWVRSERVGPVDMQLPDSCPAPIVAQGVSVAQGFDEDPIV